MKKLITTTLATIVAFYGYSQVHTEPNGNVGIGTTAPSYKLDVNGTANFTSTLTGTAATFNGNLTSGNGRINASAVAYSEGLAVATNGIGYGGISFHNTTNSTTPFNASTYKWGLLMGYSPIGGILNNNDLIFNYGNSLEVLRFSTSGAATFGGALTGTSATFNTGAQSSLMLRQAGDNANYNAIILNGDSQHYAGIAAGGSGDQNLYVNAGIGGAIYFRNSNGVNPRNVLFSVKNGGDASFTGNVGIGTTQTNSNLYVHGIVKSKEVKVEATVAVPDYVFEKSYDLKSLQEVEKYITENKHLPEIPSAKEIEKDGINVGEMQMKLLQKIEELTLHLIEQDKKNAAQQKEIEELRAKLK